MFLTCFDILISKLNFFKNIILIFLKIKNTLKKIHSLMPLNEALNKFQVQQNKELIRLYSINLSKIYSS